MALAVLPRNIDLKWDMSGPRVHQYTENGK